MLPSPQTGCRPVVAKAPDCEKGARALQPYIVATATTDANGYAQPAALPAGRYWVFGDAKVGDKRLMWHELADLKAGNQSLTHQRSAKPVE